jgi:hypothetical protein
VIPGRLRQIEVEPALKLATNHSVRASIYAVHNVNDSQDNVNGSVRHNQRTTNTIYSRTPDHGTEAAHGMTPRSSPNKEPPQNRAVYPSIRPC